MILFLNLLLSHLIGDYWLQTNKLCDQKRKLKIKSPFLYIHATFIGILAYAFSNAYSSFGVWAAVIALSHLVIDVVKSYIKQNPLITFMIDQFLPILVICIVVNLYLAQNDYSWSQFSFIPEGYQIKVPSLLCAIVICSGMANFIIKLILERFHIDVPKTGNMDLEKAGALKIYHILLQFMLYHLVSPSDSLSKENNALSFRYYHILFPPSPIEA